MKTIKRKMCYMAVLAFVGLSFMIMGLFRDGSLLGGTGAGMAAVSILKLVQYWRIRSDPEKIRQLEITQSEERLVFIAEKARSYTFFGIMVAEYIAMIVFMLLGRDSLAATIAYIVCGELLLYLIIYKVLSKKY